MDKTLVPSIADQTPGFSSAEAADVAEAEAAVARLDGYIRGTAPPGSDLRRSLVAALALVEAIASSRIEGVSAEADEVATARLGLDASRDAGLVATNAAMIVRSTELTSELAVPDLLDVHELLLARTQPTHAGSFRDQRVWIQGSWAGIERAEYVAPEPESLGRLISDLLEYLKRDDIPMLAHAAIAHAQFETIHPFADGNGRAGRALIHSMFARTKLTDVSPPISRHLSARRDKYYDALKIYRAGEVAPIVSLMCNAGREAAVRGRRLVAALIELREVNREHIRARPDSAAWRINDVLLGQPVVNLGYLADRLRITQPAVHRAISRLVDAGILQETTAQTRFRIWRAAEVLGVLDEAQR